MKRHALLAAAGLVLLSVAVGGQQPVEPGEAGRVADRVPILEIQSDSGASIACQGCHEPGKPMPYLGGARFHVHAHEQYESSVHALVSSRGAPGATCLDCHSSNGQWDTVFRFDDPRSTVHRANVSATCAKCHGAEAESFRSSIHGLGQSRGVNASASCADCHGSHAIVPSTDPKSMLSPAAMSTTCSACHQTIRADYEASSHFKAVARGDAGAPVCVTCHSAVSHGRAPASTRDFNIETVTRCGECHEKQAPSYRDTFHGQSLALGFRPSATCADCHTSHRNLPASDTESSVHAGNLIGTCGRCHPGATSGFVTYDPHAEPSNPDRSAVIYWASTFMNLLFVAVFGFFGIHTVLWLQRSIVGLARGEAHRIRDGEQWIIRFGRSDRATHAVMAASFIVLAATGLPLMYYYTGWGQGLAAAVGGLDVTRFLHRVFAVVTFGYAIFHVSRLGWKWIVKRERGLFRGPDSMVPRRKDFADLIGMVRWFVYVDKTMPRFDRWTYWEKFDYFAVFWGVPIIGLSGLVLWCPNWFSAVLPGEFLNVAMIVHGEEALLATGFIFAFHFFHNHMRPENFPLDTVVFTGRLPLARFQEERPEEYRRLVEEGRLEDLLADAPSRRARLLAAVFGFSAYAAGLVLIGAIFWTMVRGR